MLLFDEELMQLNPRDTYIASVRADIYDFKLHEKKMLKADVCDASDVIYKKVRGRHLSYVLVTYVISEGNDYQTTYQKYILRQDEKGRWKVLTFGLSDEDGS